MLLIKLLSLNPLSFVFISLPDDKILERSKFIAFADYIINVTEKLKLVLGREENIVGTGENACSIQHFLLFPQCFPKCSFIGSLILMIVWDRVNSLPDEKIVHLFTLKALAYSTLVESMIH